MDELKVLETLSWIGVILGIIALWYSVRSILTANGTRPVLMVLGLVSAWVILFSFAITDLTYGLDQINSDGRHYYEVFFMRVFSWPVSLAVIWLKWKNDHMAHPLHAGPATMCVPVTITQEVIGSGEIK